jgi:hypothetical protein
MVNSKSHMPRDFRVAPKHSGKRMRARRMYQLLHQKERESIFEFRERTTAAPLKMKALEIDMPSDIEQAINFIDALDPKRYGHWQVEIANAQLRGVNIYPTSLVDAATQAANRRLVMKGQSESHEQVVFMSKCKNVKAEMMNHKKEKRDLSKIKCFKCSQFGHYASKCGKDSERIKALSKVSNIEESAPNLADVNITFVSSG